MTEQIIRWLGQYEMIWITLGIGSALMFAFSLLLLPWLLCKIPQDYFCKPAMTSDRLTTHTLLRNMLGFPILLAGVLMLVLPGQGLLTLLLGLAIMDFPGKFGLERWLVNRKGVLSSINWVRQRTGCGPLLNPTQS